MRVTSQTPTNGTMIAGAGIPILVNRPKELLARYRRGEPVQEGCSLNKALVGYNRALDQSVSR
jgi:hypothetical protein